MSEMSPTARTAAPRRERLVAKGRVIPWAEPGFLKRSPLHVNRDYRGDISKGCSCLDGLPE
jgi:hypothetical protein